MATPLATGTVAVVVPSPKSKVTVPVGAPAPGGTGATRAISVTVWPTADGVGDEVTTVVVAAGATACMRVFSDGAKSPSPAYSAAMV
ncbi:hypothetical protein ACFQ10_08200 [Streptomyces indonesiensis]